MDSWSVSVNINGLLEEMVWEVKRVRQQWVCWSSGCVSQRILVLFVDSTILHLSLATTSTEFQ